MDMEGVKKKYSGKRISFDGRDVKLDGRSTVTDGYWGSTAREPTNGQAANVKAMPVVPNVGRKRGAPKP